MKRFDEGYCGMLERADGEWVLYTDHCEAMKRAALSAGEAQQRLTDEWLEDTWQRINNEAARPSLTRQPVRLLFARAIEARVIAALSQPRQMAADSDELSDERILEEYMQQGSWIKTVRALALSRDMPAMPVAYVGWGGEDKPKTLLLKVDLPVGTSLYAGPAAQQAECGNEPSECHECHGTGRVEVTHEPLRDGYTETIRECCDNCQGTGKMVADSAGGAQPTQPMQLPESMSRDEMLAYYSQYANVQANEALRYQKRIRDLEALLAAQPPAAAEAVVLTNENVLDIAERHGCSIGLVAGICADINALKVKK